MGELSRTVDADGGGRVARFKLVADAAVDRGVLQEEGGVWNVVGCEQVVAELVTIRCKRGAGCAQNKTLTLLVAHSSLYNIKVYYNIQSLGEVVAHSWRTAATQTAGSENNLR